MPVPSADGAGISGRIPRQCLCLPGTVAGARRRHDNAKRIARRLLSLSADEHQGKGSAGFPAGIRAINFAFTSSVNTSVMGVLMKPGAMELTVTPLEATS